MLQVEDEAGVKALVAQGKCLFHRSQHEPLTLLTAVTRLVFDAKRKQPRCCCPIPCNTPMPIPKKQSMLVKKVFMCFVLELHSKVECRIDPKSSAHHLANGEAALHSSSLSLAIMLPLTFPCARWQTSC